MAWLPRTETAWNADGQKHVSGRCDELGVLIW
jgi:hypothetical protein